jgi:thioredoxin 1
MHLKIIAVAVGLLAVPLEAANAAGFTEETPFSQNAFASAQKADAPILVHITASWCTTYAAQKPIIDKLMSDPRFEGLRTFNIDFDSQKKFVQHFGARMQSTLIVFKGNKEAGRSSGETDPKAISALLEKAI